MAPLEAPTTPVHDPARRQIPSIVNINTPPSAYGPPGSHPVYCWLVRHFTLDYNSPPAVALLYRPFTFLAACILASVAAAVSTLYSLTPLKPIECPCHEPGDEPRTRPRPRRIKTDGALRSHTSTSSPLPSPDLPPSRQNRPIRSTRRSVKVAQDAGHPYHELENVVESEERESVGDGRAASFSSTDSEEMREAGVGRTVIYGMDGVPAGRKKGRSFVSRIKTGLHLSSPASSLSSSPATSPSTSPTSSFSRCSSSSNPDRPPLFNSLSSPSLFDGPGSIGSAWDACSMESKPSNKSTSALLGDPTSKSSQEKGSRNRGLSLKSICRPRARSQSPTVPYTPQLSPSLHSHSTLPPSIPPSSSFVEEFGDDILGRRVSGGSASFEELRRDGVSLDPSGKSALVLGDFNRRRSSEH